jgi:hypothetical protein
MTDLTTAKTHDLTDEQAQSERAKALELRAVKRTRMLRELMADPVSRAYFFDLLAACHLLGAPPSLDTGSMAFWLGEHNIGKRIWVDLEKAAPDLMMQMLKERGDG